MKFITLLILSFTPLIANSNDTTIEIFIREKIQESNSIKSIKAQFREAVETSKSTQADWTTSLSGKTGQFNKDYSSLLIKDSGMLTEIGLSQSSSLGLNFSTTFSQYNYSKFQSGTGTDNTLAAVISLDLYRNLFGRSSRLKNEAAKALEDSSFYSAQSAYNEICKTIISDYISLYFMQEKLKIIEQQYDQAEEVTKVITNLYERRLIPKIDELSARADLIRVSSERNAVQSELNTQKQNAFSDISINKNAKIISPEGWFEIQSKTHIAEIDETSTSALALNYKSISNAKKYYYLDEQSKPKVQAFLETSKTESTQSFSNYDYKTVLVGLKLDWDIFGNTKSYEATAALAAANSSQFLRDAEYINTKLKRNELKEKLNLYSNEITLSQKRLEINLSKLKEAERLLKSGKIEFEHYVLHRNASLQSELEFLGAKTNYWNAYINYRTQFDKVPEYCGDLNDKLN